MGQFRYSKEELYYMGPQRVFKSDAGEAAFPLGGIGTGNISIGARGELRDWEIFNKPGKGNKMPYSFFCIWAKPYGGGKVAKVLESRIRPPYNQTHGYLPGLVAGLPHMDDSALQGEYPFVRINFKDRDLPVNVSLEAFTPFIPLNADDSGIPGAVMRYIVMNTGERDVDVTIAGSMVNLAGFSGFDDFGNMIQVDGLQNEYKTDKRLKGVFYTSTKLQTHHQLKADKLP